MAKEIERLLTIDDLAEILSVKRSTIIWHVSHSDKSRLPKVTRLPGTRGPRWRRADVEKWIDAHVEKGD